MLLFGARTRSLGVNEGIHRWTGCGEVCDWCNENIKETEERLIVECRGRERERANFIPVAKGIAGSELWEMMMECEDPGLGILL